MPLARIVTDFPEEALDLAAQLRARGFQIETLSSQATPSTIADLEVRLEECAVEDILAHANQMGASDVACVYVTPGALEEGGRSAVKTIDLVAALDERQGAETVSEKARVTDPIPVHPIHVELPESAFAVTREHIEILNSDNALDADVGATMVPVDPDVVEAAVANDAGASDQDLLLTKVKAEATPIPLIPPGLVADHLNEVDIAAESHVIPISTTAQRTVLAENENAVVEQQVLVGQDQAISLASPHVRRAPVTILRSRKDADRAFWRIAVASAVMAALVVAVGSLWHRFRPMPANLSEPTPEQILPFRKASIPALDSQKGETTEKAAVPTPSVPAEVIANRTPSAQSNSAVAAQPAPASATATASQVGVHSSAGNRVLVNKPSAKRKPSAEPDIIAEDTVVFYNRKPGAGPARSASQPSTGQYSNSQ